MVEKCPSNCLVNHFAMIRYSIHCHSASILNMRIRNFGVFNFHVMVSTKFPIHIPHPPWNPKREHPFILPMLHGELTLRET